ncbi:MAG TPA: transcriptional regulator [Rhodothermales bacterium]|nr:transcriptional regulator [Rhodothermales bacterium]
MADRLDKPREAEKLTRKTRSGSRAGDVFPVELDRLVHERIRLGILSALAATDRLSFNDLKGLLATTDGNLSVHARKLEEAGYIACTKSFDDRTPKTEYRLSLAGRRALDAYLSQMESIIQVARNR